MSDLPKNTIAHYASKYYDPVKAHEYYMRTRKLKGHNSTSGLNEKGREAARYIRQKLSEERKSTVDASKASTKSKIESIRSKTENDIRTYTTQTQAKIDWFVSRLKNMRPDQKKRALPLIKTQISRLKESNAQKRASLIAAYKKDSASYQEEHRQITQKAKEDYNSKYAAELEKIKSSPEFKAIKKSSNKKSSNKKSSGGSGMTKEWIEKNKAEYARTHKTKK